MVGGCEFAHEAERQAGRQAEREAGRAGGREGRRKGESAQVEGQGWCGKVVCLQLQPKASSSSNRSAENR
jgi:hypothetical protein